MNEEVKEVIKETKDYFLTTGESVESKSLCYQIINKKHGVIEAETFYLPQALRNMRDLQTALDEIDTETKVNKPSSNVSQIKI